MSHGYEPRISVVGCATPHVKVTNRVPRPRTPPKLQAAVCLGVVQLCVAELCQKTSRCGAGVWLINGAAGGQCYMKSKQPDMEPYPRAGRTACIVDRTAAP